MRYNHQNRYQNGSKTTIFWLNFCWKKLDSFQKFETIECSELFQNVRHCSQFSKNPKKLSSKNSNTSKSKNMLYTTFYFFLNNFFCIFFVLIFAFDNFYIGKIADYTKKISMEINKKHKNKIINKQNKLN